MARPGKGSLMSKASAMPNTTVMPMTENSNTSVFFTAGPKASSVKKYR